MKLVKYSGPLTDGMQADHDLLVQQPEVKELFSDSNKPPTAAELGKVARIIAERTGGETILYLAVLCDLRDAQTQ